MKKRILALLFGIVFLAACSSSNQPQAAPSANSLPILASTSTQLPAPSATAKVPTSLPTGTSTQVPTPTVTTQPEEAFCDELRDRHNPPEGFITFCDPDYGLALDYPMTWGVTYLSSSSDAPGISTTLVRRATELGASDMSNYVLLDTYRMPTGSTLEQQVEKSSNYPYREITDKPYDIRIGGDPAVVILNRWHQDYSAVYLYFQHGEFYSILEVKAISESGLATNWQIASSIQTAGVPERDNKIPDELIEDSYKLIDPMMVP